MAKIKINQQGQVLIAISFIMVLALAIGLAVSDRFVKGIRLLTGSDDSAKAMGVAEAAVEKILLSTTETLTDYINNGTCGSNCTLDITDGTGQHLTAQVTLSFTGQSSSDPYPLALVETQGAEVALSGYTSGQNVYVCWNTLASVVATYIYSQSGTTRANVYACNGAGSSHSENNFCSATGLYGYSSCMTISASNTPLALRLRPVYMDTDVAVLPAPGVTLPIQGILIEAVGRAGSAQKKVSVVKTNPYVPSVFDYGLYQKSTSEPLSN